MYVIQYDVFRFLEILVAREIPPVAVVIQVRRASLSWKSTQSFMRDKAVLVM